jgi:hypothetical protein
MIDDNALCARRTLSQQTSAATDQVAKFNTAPAASHETDPRRPRSDDAGGSIVMRGSASARDGIQLGHTTRASYSSQTVRRHQLARELLSPNQ